MAEEGDYDDDDDDDRSPSAGSAASLELYQSVRGMIPDGHLCDRDQISMKSDCAAGLRRRLSLLNAQAHKVCVFYTRKYSFVANVVSLSSAYVLKFVTNKIIGVGHDFSNWIYRKSSLLERYFTKLNR